MAVIFVKYDCGCIGLRPDEKEYAYIIDACDDDDRSVLGFHRRPMFGKACKPITEKGEEMLVSRIQRQMYDGFRFKEIQTLLLFKYNDKLKEGDVE